MIRKLFIRVALCVLLCAGGALRAYAKELPLEDYRAVQSEFELLQETYEICEEYSLDEEETEAVFAIMWHESRMQTDVPDSPTNDRGLCQINEVNWQWLAEKGLDVSDPVQNIEAGVLILSKFTEKYDLEYALRCYAAGETGASNGGGKRAAKEILDIMEIV